MDRERRFAMFCTYEPLALIAIVTDEIAAVESFRQHVGYWGRHHVPYIHMEPMRAEWPNERTEWSDDDAERIRASFGPNLFRAPVKVEP